MVQPSQVVIVIELATIEQEIHAMLLSMHVPYSLYWLLSFVYASPS